ncbi:MAG: GvpL/GvpF family gas vesicle protein [bacterium]
MNPEQEICNKLEVDSNLKRDEGRYIYCIIGASEARKFSYPAIGDRGDEVHSISYQDIAVVVSSSPVIKYPISRENTMAHQKVLEKLMEDFTVLPVRFGTVASSKNGVLAEERIEKEVLKARYEELKDLLTKMHEKIELGVKALWCDMKTIFERIVEENRDIKILKQRIASKNPLHTYGDRVTLGEKVKDALARKKAKEEKDILNVLKETYVDMCTNKIFGDNMITNCAFLVEKSKVEQFDKLVNKLSTDYSGRIRFKYVGPVPPCNFVELVITLGGEEYESN